MEFWINLSPQIKVFFLSMLPVTEARLSVPLGLEFYHLSVFETLFFAIVGNIIASAVVFFGLHLAGEWCMRCIPFCNRVLSRFLSRAQRVFKGKYETLGIIGLILFVGIPLPMTGGWTGAGAAYVFGFDKKKSILAISIGVVLAAVIMTFATLGVEWIVKLVI